MSRLTPWNVQICPFCVKEYASQSDLCGHLLFYIGEHRLPADGIHDVLQINRLVRLLSPCKRYRCPTCYEVISTRWQFIKHAFYERRCGVGVRNWRQYRFSIPVSYEKTVWESFLFLRLPVEIRRIVYEYLLCFEEIVFTGGIRTAWITPYRSGLYLQHNPTNHPLAIMSTNHQVYEEARQVFYGLNRFAFPYPRSLPLFLVGIGQDNAMLLRSVRWKSFCQYQEQYEEVAEKIRICLEEKPDTLKSDFFIDHLVAEPRGDWNSARHRVRPRNTADALDGRERWSIYGTWHRYNMHGHKIYGQGMVTFELCVEQYA